MTKLLASVLFAASIASASFYPFLVAAETSAEQAITIRLEPAEKKFFVHTSSVKSRNSVKRPNDKDGRTVADVMTNIIEIETDSKGFEGTLPFTVKLQTSQAQAITQKLQPLPRQSPLQSYIGTKAKYNLYPDGEIKVADVQTVGTLTPEAIKTMLAMGEAVIHPVNIPDRKLKVGDTFETSHIRSFPVGGEIVSAELLQKYTLTEITNRYVNLKSETVLRPRRKTQAQKVFGKGSGTLKIDRTWGVVSDSHDYLNMEARVLGPRGWILVKSDAETKNVTKLVKR